MSGSGIASLPIVRMGTGELCSQHFEYGSNYAWFRSVYGWRIMHGIIKYIQHTNTEAGGEYRLVSTYGIN